MTFARKIRASLLALAALAAAGCAESIGPTPLDEGRAREALKVTLDAWKGGSSTDALKSGPQAIVAQDLDWQAGARLVDYAIVGDGKKVDSNLRVPVKLTLKGASGKDAVKTVNYLVTTSPKVTVFRGFP